jgi:hypothetical protein
MSAVSFMDDLHETVCPKGMIPAGRDDFFPAVSNKNV